MIEILSRTPHREVPRSSPGYVDPSHELRHERERGKKDVHKKKGGGAAAAKVSQACKEGSDDKPRGSRERERKRTGFAEHVRKE